MKAFLLLLGLSLSFMVCGKEGWASAPFLRISEGYKDGAHAIFIRPTTTFQRSALMLDITVDGSKANLERPSPDLWLYSVGEAAGVIHLLSVKVSLGNSIKVKQVEKSIAVVAQDISAIEAALTNATSPEEIAALTVELSKKQRLKGRLEADRENLKNFVGTQNYAFKNS